MPRLGRGIELPAAGLDKGHQTLLAAVIGAVEKQQVFEKMRQARVRGRLIMTARRHPHTDRRLSTARLTEHSQLQPIGQARANRRGSRDGR